MRRSTSLALFVCAVLAARGTGHAQSALPPSRERVTFKSGALTLTGYLFKPAGAGPFPAVVWNHGSERTPNLGPQFDSVAAIFVPAGYVVLAPVRRGHGDSDGDYIVDVTQRETATHGAEAGRRLVVQLLEREQLADQLAGLAYLKKLAYVDTTRLVDAGCSYGGIQTLLGAERGVGYKAAISISPAALSWQGNPELRDRLRVAVAHISIPVMLIQPPKDASLEPAHVLGPILQKASPRSTVKIYPETGPEDQQVHCFGGARGMHIWAADALQFLRTTVH